MRAEEPRGGPAIDLANLERAKRVLALMASQWGLPVLEEVARGERRFNALHRQVEGISHRLLTVTLRRLTAEGLVNRADLERNPPHIEYTLTEAGRAVVTTTFGF